MKDRGAVLGVARLDDWQLVGGGATRARQQGMLRICSERGCAGNYLCCLGGAIEVHCVDGQRRPRVPRRREHGELRAQVVIQATT